MPLLVPVDQNRMKKNVFLLFAAFALLPNFYGCTPSPEQVMGQYEKYSVVSADENKSGVSVDT